MDELSLLSMGTWVYSGVIMNGEEEEPMVDTASVDIVVRRWALDFGFCGCESYLTV